MLAAFISMNIAVAGRTGRGGDLLLPWRGIRAALFEGGEPYSGATANAVQREVYGRGARAGEKPYILDTPFQIMLLYTPLGALQDPTLARGVDLFLLEAGLLALTFLSVQLTDWKPRRLFAILLFLLTALSFYSLWSLLEGSPAALLGLIYAGILLSLRGEKDELAGTLMALSLFGWEIGGPFLALIFLRIFQQRRWRVLSGFFMTSFVMLVIAFFLYPGWVVPFLRANLANFRWDYGFTPGAVFTRIWPECGERLGWALTGSLLVTLFLEWRAARKAEFRRFYWSACVALAATPLLGLRTEMQNLVVLIIPLAFIFAIARERWKAGYWLSGMLLALVFLVPWALLLGAGIPARLRDDLLFLFLPVFTVAGLYWIRWWAIRPPRTWLERATIPEYR